MSRMKAEKKAGSKTKTPAIKSGSKDKSKEKDVKREDSGSEQASDNYRSEEDQAEQIEEADVSSADEEKQPLSARKKRRRTQSLADKEDAKLSQAEQLQALTINPKRSLGIV